MAAKDPSAGAILQSLEDVSPVFVQRFLEERGITPGKGYTREKTLERLGKLHDEAAVSTELLRELALDWRESGEKHVHLWKLTKQSAAAITQRVSTLPAPPQIPAAPTSAEPTVLYGGARGALSKVVFGRVAVVRRPNYESMEVESFDVPVIAVLEIDSESLIATLSVDPQPAGFRAFTAGEYALAFDAAARGFAPEVGGSLDLAVALEALEHSPLVRLSSTRGIDEDATIVQLASQVELRDGQSFKALAGRIVVRETGRYIWQPGQVIDWDGLKLSLNRELRADIDAAQGLMRIQSQTTSRERRYVICQIYAHL